MLDVKKLLTDVFDPQTGEVVRSNEPLRYGRVFDLEAMLDRYYRLREWDRDGKPTEKALHRLGLGNLTRQNQTSEAIK